ncbi:hypothetical protein ACWGOQ_0014155 [Aquimarina sp. M1]
MESVTIERRKYFFWEIRSGFISKVLINEGGKEIWYENEIKDYNPSKYLSVILKGGNLGKSPMLVKYELIEKTGVVRLEYTCSWEPKEIFLKIIHPIIKKTANKNAEKVLSELKKQIEE